MKTLYLDLISGASGDMFLGALLDLGLDFARLEAELKKLDVDGYHLHQRRGEKWGISGVKFDVHLAHEAGRTHSHEDHGHSHGPGHSHDHTHGHSHAPASFTGLNLRRTQPKAAALSPAHTHDDPHEHGRNFSEIRKLIETSALSDFVKTKAVAVFHRIAVAEGKIHGKPADEVHFHEVGAVDSIVDIVGACIGLDLLGRPRVLASAVVEGTGWVNCAHGRFPVPAPATLEIWAARGVTISQCDEPHELITPTGAALLAEFAESFGLLPGLTVEKVGYGLGTRDNKTRPNVLRAIWGETAAADKSAGGNDWEKDTVAVLETNLDDMNPELLGHFLEKALAAGALDVFHTPIQMKKSRTGAVLTVLCPATEADRFATLILTETSALGVRQTVAERRKLRRETVRVQTAYGEVIVKRGLLNGRVVQTAPEFESCRTLAAEKNVPVKAVYEAALAAALHAQA